MVSGRIGRTLLCSDRVVLSGWGAVCVQAVPQRSLRVARAARSAGAAASGQRGDRGRLLAPLPAPHVRTRAAAVHDGEACLH